VAPMTGQPDKPGHVRSCPAPDGHGQQPYRGCLSCPVSGPLARSGPQSEVHSASQSEIECDPVNTRGKHGRLRLLWRSHCREFRALIEDRDARLEAIGAALLKAPWIEFKILKAEADRLERARLPRFPDELRNLTCGARTRAGTPCKLTGLYDSGRCKLHGGLSRGPTSEGGRARALANLRRGSNPMRGWEKTTLAPLDAPPSEEEPRLEFCQSNARVREGDA
jgi:hypothetical protein